MTSYAPIGDETIKVITDVVRSVECFYTSDATYPDWFYNAIDHSALDQVQVAMQEYLKTERARLDYRRKPKKITELGEL